MSILQFDPDNWLLGLTRTLKSYVEANINADDLVNVEMSYPDTDDWTKETPLAKTLIHFEIDNQQNPVIGFGTPGKPSLTVPTGYDPADPLATDPQTERIDEAAWHIVNFDVGVWASVESGGGTARMKYHQLLVNLFTVAGAKQKMYDDTGGIWVVSFDGGRHATDRINDLPVWRALEMTLIVRVSSRHGGMEVTVPDGIGFVDEFTIADEDGNQVPV